MLNQALRCQLIISMVQIKRRLKLRYLLAPHPGKRLDIFICLSSINGELVYHFLFVKFYVLLLILMIPRDSTQSRSHAVNW